MPLSEQEQRAFDQIAAAIGSGHLTADPSEPRLRRARRLRLSSEICAVAALAVFVLALFTPTPRVQVITFVLFAVLLSGAAALFLLGGRRSRTVLCRPFVQWRTQRRTRRSLRSVPPVASYAPSASRRPLRQRLEDRWEERYRAQFGDR